MAQSLEGLSESEIQDELSPILIQAAYVHALLGEIKEASEILSGFNILRYLIPFSTYYSLFTDKLLCHSDTDPLTKDLLINNILALHDNHPAYNLSNPHVTLRHLDSVVQTVSSKSSYIKFQRKIISENRLSVEYLAGKEIAVKKGIKRHLEEFPEDEGVRLLTFRPAILDPFSTGGKYSNKNVLKRALKRFSSGEKTNVALGVAIIQLLMEKKKVDHAAEILEQMFKSGVPRYAGLVAVEREIFGLQGRKSI